MQQHVVEHGTRTADDTCTEFILCRELRTEVDDNERNQPWVRQVQQ